MAMGDLEKVVSKTVYDSLKRKAKMLSWFEMGLLQQALEKDTPVEQLPTTLRKHFLDVGMEVVKALQFISEK